MRLFLFWLAIGLDFARGKIFEKCELASDLVTKYNVSSEEVKSLVCIAEFESTFNSAAINHFNWDGSKDFGLFQLNNKYWCGKEVGQNVCKTSCEVFLDDDLTDDLRCVQKIIKDTKRWMKVKNGYVAWVAYVNRCQNRNLDEYMSECVTALTTTTMATSEAPVVTTVKQEVKTTTSLTTKVPSSTLEPIRTTQQKPDQVRGPQVPIRTSQQKPEQVRGPQIPIYRPIPVRDSKPQTEIQSPLINDGAVKPSKATLMNIDLHKDTAEHLSPQSINPMSVLVVEKLLHALTSAMSQFDFKLTQTPTRTSLMNDVDVNLPDVESHHPELHSQAVPEVGNYLDNVTPVLHTPTQAEVLPNISNKLNKFIYGGLANTDTNKLGLKLFPNHPIANPFKVLTGIQTIEPAGIPITNNYNSLQFHSSTGKIRSPYLALNRYNYYAAPFGNPLINSQGTYPQFFINGYGVYNPHQNFHRNRNVLLI